MVVSYLFHQVRSGAHGGVALLSLWRSRKGPVTQLCLREKLRMDCLA